MWSSPGHETVVYTTVSWSLMIHWSPSSSLQEGEITHVQNKRLLRHWLHNHSWDFSQLALADINPPNWALLPPEVPGDHHIPDVGGGSLQPGQVQVTRFRSRTPKDRGGPPWRGGPPMRHQPSKLGSSSFTVCPQPAACRLLISQFPSFHRCLDFFHKLFDRSLLKQEGANSKWFS